MREIVLSPVDLEAEPTQDEVLGGETVDSIPVHAGEEPEEVDEGFGFGGERLEEDEEQYDWALGSIVRLVTAGIEGLEVRLYRTQTSKIENFCGRVPLADLDKYLAGSKRAVGCIYNITKGRRLVYSGMLTAPEFYEQLKTTVGISTTSNRVSSSTHTFA